MVRRMVEDERPGMVWYGIVEFNVPFDTAVYGQMPPGQMPPPCFCHPGEKRPGSNAPGQTPPSGQTAFP